MNEHALEPLIQLLNEEIIPFSINDETTYQLLAEKIGDARIVLLGEASHGTHEFYQTRAELSKYLITHKNFHAIAIEGDWTSVYPVNLFIQGHGNKSEVEDALKEFDRFPTWMWRNKTMLPFLQWLREYNDSINSETQKIGFYGLDLYCLSSSMQSVIDYLNNTNPEAAKKAMHRYACFDHTAVDPQTYGYLVDSRLQKDCIQEVTEQLLEMQRMAFDQFHNHPTNDKDDLFYAMQNARVVKNAEHYYRALFESRELTWNIRDQHMGETLQNLIAHLETKLQTPAKIIIWAHNSHIGDARATEMAERKEINLGQIVREHFGTTSFHLGFSTYTGTVTAAYDWDKPAETKQVVPGMPGSFEALFHKLNIKNFILDLHHGEHVNHLLELSRLQRAIGVIYRPETERESHYFFTHLPYQFDALIHIDETTALEPLASAKERSARKGSDPKKAGSDPSLADPFLADIEHQVIIPSGKVQLDGLLYIPENALGLVLFVHGSGSSRLSVRNQHVARILNQAKLATLLFDLFTPEEDAIDAVTAELRFNIDFLATRLLDATHWCNQTLSDHCFSLGYFGASTGGGAALVAVAKEISNVKAVVSRGGRPDLAKEFIPQVSVPTLLIVGGNDFPVIEMNEEAMSKMNCIKKLEIVPNATHLFEEPGTLDQVASLSRDWFLKYLTNT